MKKTLDEQIAFYEKQLKLLKLLKEQPKEFHSLADYAQATGVKIAYVYMLINRYNIKVQTYTGKQEEVLELVSDFKERFDTHTPAYAMPLMWVRKKDVDKTYLITGFCSTEEGKFVSIGIVYTSLGVLFEDYTFLDGSPCGVRAG